MEIARRSALRVLIAPDKFKGAASAWEVARALAEGVRMAAPEARVMLCPLADGGDGALEVMSAYLQAEVRHVEVTGPLGKPVRARWGWSPGSQTALIEMAAASGMALIPTPERKAGAATTLGTGELISEALRAGARRLVLALGGSATNDGGTGMAQALGYRFLDSQGHTFLPTGFTLKNIARIEAQQAALPDPQVEVIVACDVQNPLLGPDGATSVFGAQKGATPLEQETLETGMAHLASLWERQFGKNLSDAPGAGAAGGMGAGAEVFLGGKRVSGIDLVMEMTGFHEKLALADLVLTAEGRLDVQTLSGKVIRGVCDAASRAGIPVAAFCGQLDLEPPQIQQLGLIYADSIQKGPLSLGESLQMTLPNLTFGAWKFVFAWETARQKS